LGLTIDNLLRELVSREASDLHIKAGQPPIMRIHGELKRADYPPLSAEETRELLLSILNEDRKARLYSFKELDLSYHVPGLSRFRVNMFWQRHNMGAVFRVIPFKIRTIDDLRMPAVCKQLALMPRGLILVTGPTGSGKSTSLAAMVHHINVHKRCHIMTVEDPIEYVHSDEVSIINQRELATDTHSFADALKHVMRQNPDVILVGEMRDLETIQLAITAAETIDRIVDVFSPEQQAQIRTQLSVTLQAVVSQTLIPTKDGMGRVAAFEVMVATPAIRTLIRDGKTHQLYLDIQTGASLGMQTLDGCLLGLLRENLIDYEHALSKCSNPSEFQRRAINQGLVEVPSASH
jgi:twitching motility protein PilT